MTAIRPIAPLLFNAASRTATFSRQPLCSTRAVYQTHTIQQHRQRGFVTSPFNLNSISQFAASQSLTAQRTIRCPPSVVYSIISDVASYSAFVPFCQESIVTKTSAPAPNGKTYPEEAKLVIGFNDTISETFTSRVYCVPERVVEAVSGASSTTLPAADIAHHGARPADPAADPSRRETVMASLLTRWTLRPYHYKPPPEGAHTPATAGRNHDETSPVPAQEKTEVNLTIEFQFANPLYAAMSSAAAPKVAEKMIEAFEKRVEAVIEGHGHV